MHADHVAVPEGVLAVHVPFVLEEGRVAGPPGARPTPSPEHLHAGGPAGALLIVSGPDGYVSPDWYGEPRNRMVPTWNYVAVHLRGELRLHGGERRFASCISTV